MMASPTRRDRILGALLGVHAGDSLGATVEFSSWEEIRESHPHGVRDIVGGGPFNWPAGHATDDTDLTRAVLLGYRDAKQLDVSTSTEKPDVVKLSANHMLDWYEGRWPDRREGQRPCDIGGATAVGIRKLRLNGGDPRRAGAGQGKAGNGSLMRCIPTALFGPKEEEESLSLETNESMAISAVTHDDTVCTLACAVYNAIVRALVEGQGSVEAWQRGRDVLKRLPVGAENSVAEAARKVEAAIDGARFQLGRVDDLAGKGPKGGLNGAKLLPFKASGYVLESLIIAVAALFDTRSLEEVLIDVVRIGKDTDTNAAIAGGLLGARDGVDAIPKRWRDKLQFSGEFTEIVDFML
ncbi:ADP-ribosylation/Crystallin J1 [Bombardia bombarda]|uniref:ADP-ribosylhydrolase ARH3 n=1 Tax=Bombardia bombarda TaxID=252184 RepID=A0AA40C252_9PEZI|nr:ADP-ribosylation/Crystallin J1 [Bombardia bombarda]